MLWRYRSWKLGPGECDIPHRRIRYVKCFLCSCCVILIYVLSRFLPSGTFLLYLNRTRYVCLRSNRLRIYYGVCTYSKQYTYLDYFAMNLVFSHTWHWYIYRVRVYHTQVVSDHSILRRVGMMIHTRRARHCVLAACWVSGCTINIYLLSPSLGTSTRHGNTAHTYFTTYL